MPDSNSIAWRKSTYSGGSGQDANCVEVGFAPQVVAVRDTKNRQGAILTFTPRHWRSFLTTLS